MISELPDYEAFEAYLEGLGLFHMELGPRRMHAALAALSLTTLPHLAVQVVGTNGKGSTGAFLAGLLAAHGLPTGLYLSRIFAACASAFFWPAKRSPSRLAGRGQRRAGRHLPGGEAARLTYFELLTAMAAWMCTRQGAEAAGYEAGLGGAGDATTALTRDLVLFTPIGMDHASVIGPTLADIAHDKALAMVPGGVAITGPQTPEALAVLHREADRLGTKLREAGKLATYDPGQRKAILRGQRHLEIPHVKLRLAGPHQARERHPGPGRLFLAAEILGLTPGTLTPSAGPERDLYPGPAPPLPCRTCRPGCCSTAPTIRRLRPPGEALASLAIKPHGRDLHLPGRQGPRRHDPPGSGI